MKDFKPNQRVRIEAMDVDFTFGWKTKGKILKPNARHSVPDGFYLVKFDDGAKLCIHNSQLMADNA
jgi:hypothetical protein